MTEGINAWQPTGEIDTLRKRAFILESIRRYFNETGAFEVETPIMSAYGSSDVQLEQWRTEEGLTLHTSPEYAMKRLLAAGSGDIFQIGKVFRKDEIGQRHNPEFTMLEWYRIGLNEFQLMDDVARLIHSLASGRVIPSVRMTYQEAFKNIGLPDPHTADLSELQSSVWATLSSDATNWSRDDCLDALMALKVEPELPRDQLVFIYQYPHSQAALAEYQLIDDVCVARRFELYWQGMELANGYFELVSVEEQKRRFKQDVSIRAAEGLAISEIDTRFLAALESGMPVCSGVALGVDRLMMILMNKPHIRDVISFPFDRA
jgi:lysyl-tRNA synthetase class 2